MLVNIIIIQLIINLISLSRRRAVHSVCKK